MKTPEGSAASSLSSSVCGSQTNQRGCPHCQTVSQLRIKWLAQPGCFTAKDKVAGAVRVKG